MKRILISVLIVSLYGNAEWSLDSVFSGAHTLWGDKNSTDSFKTPQEIKMAEKEHLNDIWEDILDRLQKGLEIDKKIAKAPNHAFFSADKKSLRKDLNEVLDDIVKLITDDSLFDYRKEIREARESIKKSQKKILEYREERVVAPVESHFKTTKSEYDEKIKEEKSNIEGQRAKIEHIKKSLSQKLKVLGIDLTPKQVDVLLSSVDGDDIIKMTMIIHTLQNITNQLSGIMQESNEELSQAKKYYGMHMVLLELVLYVQNNFIEKIKQEYIPKVDSIISKTKNMILDTRSKISNEENLARRDVYYKNLKSQRLTLRTAILYKKNLEDELKRVEESKSVTEKNLALAKNTYETVMLSSELLDVVKENQKAMAEVMKLQVPSIVPFENKEMERKYRELTNIIKNGE